MPVPSRPNQIQIIHLAIVVGACRPLCSHFRVRRKPMKHQLARRTRVMKFASMSRRQRKTRFSESKLNARRGMRIGAAQERASRERRAHSWSLVEVGRLRA